MRTLGRMRGRSIGPTGRKKEGVGATGPSFYKERLATGSPPHPSPSVTASPQGEAFVGSMPLQRNAFSPNPCSRKMRIQIRARRWAPKQPHHRNNAPHHAKTSEWERAGHKKRGAGGIPPRLFASGLSLEKAWIPARDRAGRTTPQVPTCAGPNLDHLPTAKPPTPVEISTFLSGVPRFTIWT